jgi:hypothetical protein
MALSEDQRALLGLLLSGETYEGVAEVVGESPAEVRRRAHEAAAVAEADPVREFDPAALGERFAVLDGERPAVAPARAERRSDPRRWLIWSAVGVGAAVLVLTLILVNSGGGGGGQSQTGTQPDREDVVPVRMSPVGGSRARGTIAIVRAADQPAVDLAIRGLQPTGGGESYVLWFVGSGGRALPVAFQSVGPNGQLTGRAPVPTAASGLLPSFTTAELTLTQQRAAAAALRRAAQSATLPEPVGTLVATGALR